MIRFPNFFQKGISDRHEQRGQQSDDIIEVDFVESGTDDEDRARKTQTQSGQVIPMNFFL